MKIIHFLFPIYLFAMMMTTGCSKSDNSPGAANLWNVKEFDGKVTDLCIDQSGNVYAAVNSATLSIHAVYKLEAGTWKKIEGGLTFSDDIVKILCDVNGKVYAGKAGLSKLVTWDGSIWSEFDTNFSPGGIQFCTSDKKGNLYASGYFTGDPEAKYAKWDGTGWSALPGTPLTDADGSYYYGFVSDKTGNIFANIWIDTIGGVDGISDPGINYVAKYNGATWTELGAAKIFKDHNFKIETDDAGNIIAWGNSIDPLLGQMISPLLKWNGTEWKDIKGSNAVLGAYRIADLATGISGTVFIGADAPTNRFVAKWDGTSWSVINDDKGTPLDIPADVAGPNSSSYNGINRILTYISGNLYVAYATKVAIIHP